MISFLLPSFLFPFLCPNLLFFPSSLVDMVYFSFRFPSHLHRAGAQQCLGFFFFSSLFMSDVQATQTPHTLFFSVLPGAPPYRRGSGFEGLLSFCAQQRRRNLTSTSPARKLSAIGFPFFPVKPLPQPPSFFKCKPLPIQCSLIVALLLVLFDHARDTGLPPPSVTFFLPPAVFVFFPPLALRLIR